MPKRALTLLYRAGDLAGHASQSTESLAPIIFEVDDSFGSFQIEAMAPSPGSTRMMVQSRFLAHGHVPRRHICKQRAESFGDGEVSDDGITQFLVW